MKLKNIILIGTAIIGLWSCSGNGNRSDAYGNFEAEEIIVSAEIPGKIIALEVEEGVEYNAGTTVGLIDTMQLYLKKEQLKASIDALIQKTQDISSQINVLVEKKNNLEREKGRIKKLLEDSAATEKQWDDINGEIEVVEKQIKATKSKLETGNRGILAEINPLEYQVRQINDQINKSVILMPASGTVLTRFAEKGEFAGIGRPIFKLADLDEIFLRAYISGDQMPEIKLNQTVEVLTDDGSGSHRSYSGKVSWISDKAEFTPKTIQTREERVNLVYAIKVRVPNDGTLKIGMPGEVNFEIKAAKNDKNN